MKRYSIGPFTRLPRGRRLFILLLLCFAGAGGFVSLQGRVIAVADGDTVTLLKKEGNTQRLRLYGIDSPEFQQPGGKEAAAAASSLVLWEEVAVSLVDQDKYERDVVVVTLPDGRVLNEELIRQGHAWVYRAYCTAPQCAAWLVLEAEARQKKQGLWAGKRPVPPWKWRAEHR